jgi:uncharacterized peroxidase-related enzyme
MRLKSVERGRRLGDKLRILAHRLGTGRRAPDLFRLLLYDPEFFGRPFLAWAREVMHGASDWSEGERELFALFTSHTLRCKYCVATHTVSASRMLTPEVVQAVLSDWRTAPVTRKVGAVFAVIEKLSDSPEDVGPEDIGELRRAGLSDAAIRDALQVRALYGTVTRLASALDFDVPSTRSWRRAARDPLAMLSAYLTEAPPGGF